MKSVYFISTNLSWGGSEILWFATAEALHKSGVHVAIAARYHRDAFSKFPHFDLTHQHGDVTFLKRVKAKLSGDDSALQDQLELDIKAQNPDLVVISQGSNLGSLLFMELLAKMKVNFVTVSQLVTEHHFFEIRNQNIGRFQEAYKAAKKNFFVSQNNLCIHERMLGYSSQNLDVVLNPIVTQSRGPLPFPRIEKLKIAFVGRLECLHKGLDILMEIASSEKWKSRSVEFNIYGSGQHEVLAKSICERNGLQSSVIFRGHVNGVEQIWNENHVLFMPSRMEGQSLSLLEAMWCGRAAVTTNVGGASEVIVDGENGFIANGTTVENVEQKLDEMWQRRWELEALGLAASTSIRNVYHIDAVSFFIEKLENSVD
jgi:glycosyltransferase involved in cell wall biosynthesis